MFGFVVIMAYLSFVFNDDQLLLINPGYPLSWKFKESDITFKEWVAGQSMDAIEEVFYFSLIYKKYLTIRLLLMLVIQKLENDCLYH